MANAVHQLTPGDVVFYHDNYSKRFIIHVLVEVEIRVVLQVGVKPRSPEFNKGKSMSWRVIQMGDVANTLLFGGGLRFELVGVGNIESEMVL